MENEITSHVFLGIAVPEFLETLNDDSPLEGEAIITVITDTAKAEECFADLKHSGLITDLYFDGPDENGNLWIGLKTASLKKVLLSLLKKHESAPKDNIQDVAIQSYMLGLIDIYINHLEQSCYLEIVTTNYGLCVDAGGMELGIPYIAYDGMKTFDDDCWDDPRETDPLCYEEFRNAFLGDKDFQKFTPKFS